MADPANIIKCRNCGKPFPEKRYKHKIFREMQYLTCPGCKYDFSYTAVMKNEKAIRPKQKRS